MCIHWGKWSEFTPHSDGIQTLHLWPRRRIAELLGIGGSLQSSPWSHETARLMSTDGKWKQKTLWFKWLEFHLEEKIFSSLLTGLFFFFFFKHPVTVSGKWTNSPENRDQNVQLHTFFFFSLSCNLYNLACFIFTAVNTLFLQNTLALTADWLLKC